METLCQECLTYLANDPHLDRNQRKATWVVAFTVFAMVGEITAGYITKSMALTADGWHMASHAGALLIALMAYRLAKSQKVSQHFSFGAGKLIPLGGYTSAVILAIVAILIAGESVERLFSPTQIEFNEAIGVAFLGLTVNILSALILNHDDPLHEAHHQHQHHHDHEHEHDHDHEHEHEPVRPHKHVHDHNLRSAFLHVVADAVTSVLAIIALACGKFYHLNWLDSVSGIVGAVVILSWAYQLCRDTGWELLDGHSKTINWRQLRSALEVDGSKIIDFHVWRIAPKATACELIVGSPSPKGSHHFGTILRERFQIQHVVVEERQI